jgi:hypothetical protein
MAIKTRPLPALALAILLCACAGDIPPPPPLLEPIEPNSEAFQKAMADDLAAGLKEAQTQPVVARRFIVMWEMHYGYKLMPPADLNALVTPDFLDEAASRPFDQAQTASANHIGERLICDCVGIEWSFYTQPRFVVRSARLHWER